MKKIFKLSTILFAITVLVSCDFFGTFFFVIDNNTNDSLEVVYTEQMQTFSSVLYTPDDEDEFHNIYLSREVTDTIIPPKGKLELSYDAGLVDRGFPGQLENPMEYGILPLWERIGNMIQNGDTLPSGVFSESQWKGEGSTYTLRIK